MESDRNMRDTCSPFDIRDSVHTAVIEFMAEAGLKSVNSIALSESVVRKSKKKRRGKHGIFGIALDDDEQEKAVVHCRGKPHYLPK